MSEPRATSVTAALLAEPDGAFEIRQLELQPPRADEVLVRIVATGVCHTDAAVRARDLPTPLPVVLGHEGAGIVEAVGASVTKVAVGDHVVLTFNSCGHCDMCLAGRPTICDMCYPLNFGGSRLDGSHALCCDGAPVNDRFFGQSSFATYAIANERNAIKVTKDVPLELLGPLGCGIQTGAGAVINALKVGVGESLVVFGSGAVGMAAIMAAKVAGATTIIAVDIVPSRLEMALELGATHVVNGRDEDAAAAIGRITGKGVHYALDTTGKVDIIRTGMDVLRPGGTCGFLGASAPGSEIKVDAVMFMATSKHLRGIVGCDGVPEIFIPQLIDLYAQGRFPFDRLVRFYAFSELNQAVSDSEKGLTIKPIVRML